MMTNCENYQICIVQNSDSLETMCNESCPFYKKVDEVKEKKDE